MSDSCCCMAETKETLQNNYLSIKNFKNKHSWPEKKGTNFQPQDN